jgi:hypothetical protein
LESGAFSRLVSLLMAQKNQWKPAQSKGTAGLFFFDILTQTLAQKGYLCLEGFCLREVNVQNGAAVIFC